MTLIAGLPIGIPPLASVPSATSSGLEYLRNATIRQPWIDRVASIERGWAAIAWSPALELFAAVAASGTSSNRAMTSPDGITWTSRVATGSWAAIAWSPALAKFVAVGDGGQSMSSTDGITWTIAANIASSNWTGLTWSPALAKFVAVATSGAVLAATSPDGITWTSRTAITAAWLQVIWVEELSKFIASSATIPDIMTSPDGITWTSQTGAEANNWHGLAWSPELSLLVATSTDGVNRVMTSPDGIDWTIRTIPIIQALKTVAWSTTLKTFVALSSSGTNDKVFESVDGINWKVLKTVDQTNAAWRGIAWSDKLGKFVGVAQTSSGEQVLNSPTLVTA